MSKWYQIWVTHPTADAIALMQHADLILQGFGAIPKAPPPAGKVIKDADGTIEVRAYSEISLNMAERYLKDQGFVIERKQENAE